MEEPVFEHNKQEYPPMHTHNSINYTVMRPLNNDEYHQLKQYVTNRLSHLATHENKNCWLAMPAKELCVVYDFEDGTKIYRLYSIHFSDMLESIYNEALKYKEHFGTNDAMDVLWALYQNSQYKIANDRLESMGINNGNYTIEEYANYLSNEHFCLLVKEENGKFQENILRIDFFRKFKRQRGDNTKYDFIGGLFHILRHFSKDKQPLSYCPNQNTNIDDIEIVIWWALHAFFRKKRYSESTNTSYSEIEIYGYPHPLKFSFYTEQSSKISFIKTAFVNS
jgi:hypothetical protein